jgi:hypothetical protein
MPDMELLAVADTDPVLRRKRPFGIYVIVVLLLLNSIPSIVAAMGIGQPLDAPFASFIPDPLALRIVNGALAPMIWIVAVGLWFLRRWAWILTMISIGPSLAIGIVEYFQGTPSFDAMVLNVIVVFYLNQHDLQDLFVRRTRQELQSG